MLDDYFNQKLMRARLHELRNVIKVYKSIFDLYPSILHPIKENVGKPSTTEKKKNSETYD